MIAADRADLESRLKQLTLQIREKEVTVFTDNFAVLSTQAAFLCGLGFSGLTMVPTWQRKTAAPTATLLIFYSLVRGERGRRRPRTGDPVLGVGVDRLQHFDDGDLELVHDLRARPRDPGARRVHVARGRRDVSDLSRRRPPRRARRAPAGTRSGSGRCGSSGWGSCSSC